MRWRTGAQELWEDFAHSLWKPPKSVKLRKDRSDLSVKRPPGLHFGKQTRQEWREGAGTSWSACPERPQLPETLLQKQGLGPRFCHMAGGLVDGGALCPPHCISFQRGIWSFEGDQGLLVHSLEARLVD
jgi:hypothetical protein